MVSKTNYQLRDNHCRLWDETSVVENVIFAVKVEWHSSSQQEAIQLVLQRHVNQSLIQD